MGSNYIEVLYKNTSDERVKHFINIGYDVLLFTLADGSCVVYKRPTLNHQKGGLFRHN